MKTWRHSSTRGMTLLELVVVLAILAVVTGMAVASFTAVEDETRRNLSAELIDRVERASIGENSSEGMSIKDSMPSFLFDTGRLPKLQGADPSRYLSELWEKPTDVVAYGLVTPVIATNPTDIDDLLIGRGWRGPYLKLTVGQLGLYDAYGNPLAVEGALASHPTYPTCLTKIQALGSDGTFGPITTPVTPAHDIPLAPKVLFDPVSPGSLFPGLSVTVSKKDGTLLASSARVHLIYPDSTNVNGYTVSSATLDDATPSHIFPLVPIGPRVIRVVHNSKKYTFHFVVPRGGLTTGLPLELP